VGPAQHPVLLQGLVPMLVPVAQYDLQCSIWVDCSDRPCAVHELEINRGESIELEINRGESIELEINRGESTIRVAVTVRNALKTASDMSSE
jgi:hypothetical protein